MDTLADILKEEFFEMDLEVRFIEDWYCVVLRVPMEEDINRIVGMLLPFLSTTISSCLTCHWLFSLCCEESHHGGPQAYRQRHEQEV